MHARHYSPALGRFVQPDPDRSEANLYAYAANNPVTEMDPDGTCFIVCQLVIGAVIDTVVYFATTENASLGGLAKAVVGGAVESAINPFAKLNKVAKLAKAASKILGKVPKASRAAKKIASRAGSGFRKMFDGSRASQRGQIRVPGGVRVRRGGESAAAARGRAEHEALRARVKAKGRGWQSEPRLRGKSGREYRPDVVTPRGRFLEMKPNTFSGRLAGRWKAAVYRRELGMRGRIIYYDP